MQEFNPILVLLVVAVSVLSGAGSFLQQRRTERQKHNGWLLELVSELVIACTAGLAALFIGMWQEYPIPLTCLLSIVMASNGAFFIDLCKRFLTKKVEGIGGLK